MPLPQNKTHRLFLLRINVQYYTPWCSWVYIQILNNLGDLWKVLWICWVLVSVAIAQGKIIKALQYIFSRYLIICGNLWILKLLVIWTSGDESQIGRHGLLLAVAAKMWQKAGGHNFTVPFTFNLSSKDMYYEMNATIILDLCSHIYPWKPHVRLIFLTFLLNSKE